MFLKSNNTKLVFFKDQILALVSKFVFVGEKDIVINEALLPYKPQTSIRNTKFDEANRVRNLDAVQSLGDYFLRSQNLQMRIKTLDRITNVYAINSCNLILLQPLRLLPKLIENMETLPFELKVKKKNKITFFFF